jgi:hypothetical protein
LELKHVIFLVALGLVLTVGRAVCLRNPRLQDACAFLLVFGTTRTDLMDVNFLSREWYRGTTRGIEVSWLDLLWILLLSSLRREDRQSNWLPGLGPMLLFFTYNALVVAFSEPSVFGIFELSKMLRQLCLFVTIARYVRGDRELSIIAWALVGAVAYEWIAALRARFVWKQPRVQGTLAHANSLSMYELMSVPVLTAISVSDASRVLRRACGAAALLGAVTVLFTVSRNGVITLSLIGLFLLLTCGSLRSITTRHLLAGLGLASILGFFVAMTYSDFKTRFEAESLDKEYGGKIYEGRGAYVLLAEGIAAREPFGCGLNNWSWCVSNRYGPIVEQYYSPYVGTDSPPPKRRLRRHHHVDDPQAAPAHSLYAITLGETGFPGVVLLAIVWARWLMLAGGFLRDRSNALRSRFGIGVLGALVGAFCQSFSEWEIRQTPLAFLLHILLGAMAAAHLGKQTDWNTAPK